MKKFSTKEFAAELGCSWRTVEGWRTSRDGKQPVFAADHYTNKGRRAVYTEEQLEPARALLNRNKNKSVTETFPSLFDDVTTAESVSESMPENKPVEENHDTAQFDATIEEMPDNHESPATIDVAAEVITLDQRAEKIRRLQADVQRGIIEIGLELIAAKEEVGHGNWSKWLETEFDWTDRTARYFMAVAERFGNRNTYSVLKPSTLKAMLALPVGDEQNFIDAQDAAGKPVTKQTAREVQKNVKAWNEQHKPKPPTVDEQKHATVPEQHALSCEDDGEKLIVGNKPLDSCRCITVIDEDNDERADVSDKNQPNELDTAQIDNEPPAIMVADLRNKALTLTRELSTLISTVDNTNLARAVEILEMAVRTLRGTKIFQGV